jgi:hypothetical protein
MKKVIYFTFVLLIGYTVAINGKMKLQLSSDIYQEELESFGNHNYVSNLKLELPAQVTNPGGMGSFVKGMWLLALLADVAFPFGDDFKHIAGTGFSIHAMASYVIAAQVLISLRVGYQTFGSQSSEDEFGNYEDCYYQIPIMLSAYYLLGRGAFNPYVGLSLGLYLTTYSFKWTYTGSPFPGQESQTQEGDQSETEFGISPEAGFYYWMAATTMIQVAVAYHHLFVSGDSGISYLAIMAGVSFALSGN